MDGSEVNASIICSKPAIRITRMVDAISALRACIIDAITIVTGPVIPDTRGTFPPISPAIKQSIIAPHTPADAPNPVATPKAKA